MGFFLIELGGSESCATNRGRAVEAACQLRSYPAGANPARPGAQNDRGRAGNPRSASVQEAHRALDTQVEGPAISDHQVITQPLLTLAVAGGQKVVDALRYQAP
jgi:hypothetical protein